MNRDIEISRLNKSNNNYNQMLRFYDAIKKNTGQNVRRDNVPSHNQRRDNVPSHNQRRDNVPSHNQRREIDDRNDFKNIHFVNNNMFDNRYTNRSDNRIKYQNEKNGIRTYISMTTVPPRFFSQDFVSVIDALLSQSVKPTKVFISLCYSYDRDFDNYDHRSHQDVIERIEYIKNLSPLIEFIHPKDYGPATKLLGLLEHNRQKRFLKDEDIIIVLDDDMHYSSNIVLTHTMGHNLYCPDICAIDQYDMIKKWKPYMFKDHDTLYYDNYDGFLYGWLSFSIKYRATDKLIEFYTETVERFPDTLYHDDLLFTLYSYVQKLYCIGSSIVPLNTDKGSTYIDRIWALRDHRLQIGRRYDLERKVYDQYRIRSDHRKFVRRETVYNVSDKIPYRNFFLIDQFKILNPLVDIHVVPTYISSDLFLLTITVFNDTLLNRTEYELQVQIKETVCSIVIDIENQTKFTYMIHISNTVLKPKTRSNSKNYQIVQTHINRSMSKNRFNSIMTVLNYAPEFLYEFFDNDAVYRFVKNNCSTIVNDALLNLNPGAYVSDLFRYCYLYINGGVYLDCKKILWTPLSKFIDDTSDNSTDNNLDGNPIFIKDLIKNYSYNAVMIVDKKSKVIEDALKLSTYNSVKNIYGNDALCVTGPGVLGNCIDSVYKTKNRKYRYRYFNCQSKNNKLSYIHGKDKQYPDIINNYHGYYDEDNYKNTGHYSQLWKVSNVFKNSLKAYRDTAMSEISVLK